jgi:hypothetical protein
MGTKTYGNETYKESIEQIESEMELHQQDIFNTVNYSAAIIQDPEKFNLDHFRLREMISSIYAEQMLVYSHPRLVTIDQLIEDVMGMRDIQLTNEALESIEKISPPKEFIENVLTKTIESMAGMLKCEHLKQNMFEKLKYDKFVENEQCLIDGKPPESYNLENKDVDAFVYFGRLTVSDCNMELKHTNLTHVVSKKLGYSSFFPYEYDNEHIFPLDGARVDANVYGPVKLGLTGYYVTRVPEFLTGCYLKKHGRYKCNDDFSCASLRLYDGLTRLHSIKLYYTQTYDGGIHSLTDFYADALVQFKKMIELINLKPAANL